VLSWFIIRFMHTDYKSLCAAVTMCATLVNIRTYTDRQHFDQLIQKDQPAELKIHSTVKPYMRFR